jgi:prepilin-type N-terminal cleavage/methylation domain-containing protein
MGGVRWHGDGIPGMDERTRRRGNITGAGRVRRVPWQGTMRMGDVAATIPGGRRYNLGSGFSLLELLVAMAIFSILLGVAMPRASSNTFVLWTANQQLLADLRRTRTDALTRGDHFRLDVTGANAYAEYRMRLVGTEWLPQEPPVRSRILPVGVTFESGVGAQFEFNTRGLLADADAAGTLALHDAHNGFYRTVSVWPSGQVAPL